MTKRRVFFSVGEPSGDLHASNLILDFQREQTAEEQYEFFGFGGPKMEAAGCELMEDLTKHAVMFFSGVIAKIAKFRRLLKDAERVFANQQVDLVVLIDYSGFNWHVAKKAKRYGIPVVFYGIPQMWAWAPWRVKKMRKFVDLGICKLPFEESWLKERNCEAEYVGHPFFDEMQRQEYDSEFLDRFVTEKKLNDSDLVTILPGSRTQEIKNNLPVFLKTAQRVHDSNPNTRFVVSCLDDRQKQLAQSVREQAGSQLNEFSKAIPIVGGKTPELIQLAKCCLACSGSVSLELMYREKPTIIHYKLPSHLYLAQKLFLRIKYITLVNLLWSNSIARQGMQVYDPDADDAADVPFPEYLTTKDRSNQMADQLDRWLNNPTQLAKQAAMLSDLKAKYGAPGASFRAMQLIKSRFFNANNAQTAEKVA